MNDDVVESLIRRTTECGFVVEIRSGNTSLRPVVEGAKCPPELLRELKQNRASILAYLKAMPTEVVHCPECNATVYVWDNDRDMAFTACKGSGLCNVQCPFWRRGLTEEWWGRDRWFAQKRREQVQRVNEDDVPE